MSFPNAFVFTQSNLQDYAACARRFELRHLQRLKWPAVETEPIADRERQMKLGAAFHRMIHQSLSGIPAEAIAQSTPDETLRRWWATYQHSDFTAHLPPLRFPEVTLSAPFNGVRLLAKADLIALAPGERAVIVDWKTTPVRPSHADLARQMQTRVYPLVLLLAGAELQGDQPLAPEQIEMVYWFAEFPAAPERFLYSAAQFAEDHAHLTALLAEITTRQSFPLTDDTRTCRFCVYRSLCGRGVQPGTLQDWADGVADGVADNGMNDEGGIGAFDLDFDQIAEVEF